MMARLTWAMFLSLIFLVTAPANAGALVWSQVPKAIEDHIKEFDAFPDVRGINVEIRTALSERVRSLVIKMGELDGEKQHLFCAVTILPQ